jgi:hypothetical protein
MSRHYDQICCPVAVNNTCNNNMMIRTSHQIIIPVNSNFHENFENVLKSKILQIEQSE